jgi:Cdc6-like AAA superfamily ATPase
MGSMALLLAAAGAALCLVALRLWRLRRAHAEEISALSDRVTDLAARLEAAEHDAAQAVSHARVAGMLLLDKGIADEDEVEAARRRVDEGGSSVVRNRGGELH